MSTGLRSWIDFSQGATVTENYFGSYKPSDLNSIQIDGFDLRVFVKALERLEIQVFPKYGEQVVFDIPFQSLWSFVPNPLLVHNAVDVSDSLGWMFIMSKGLRRDDGYVPHSYSVITSARMKHSAAAAESLFSKERHHIDLSRFDSRASVIAATTYIEAMLEYVLRSLKPQIKRDLNGKIIFCREKRLFDNGLCCLLHSLRHLRNNSAHEFSRDWRVKGNRFKEVSVPQCSKAFLKSMRSFVSLAEQRYGASGEPCGKFQRAVELVAAEVNVKAGLDSVVTLGSSRPSELDEFF